LPKPIEGLAALGKELRQLVAVNIGEEEQAAGRRA